MRWLTAALILALSTPAFADGSGTLSGTGRLRVKGCGKERDAITWGVQLAGGSWTSTSAGNPGPFGGATPSGSSGRHWNLTFDPGVKAAFDQFLAAIATDLCETPVALAGPSSVTHFNLKLNKRETRAKLTLFVTGAGTSALGSSRGSLKMILRGPWQEAQP